MKELLLVLLAIGGAALVVIGAQEANVIMVGVGASMMFPLLLTI